MDTTAARRRRRVSAPVVLLLAAVLAIIAPQACAACSCIVMTFSEAADQAEVTFVGTVTGREDGQESELGPAVDYTFDVSDVYAGTAPPTAVVRTADNSAACGFDFEVGQTYLVMAGNTATGLETTLCTGTALAGDVAEEDLASLGPPSAPAGASPGGGDTGGGETGAGGTGAGGVGAGTSDSPSLGVLAGGATLGALLAGLLVWWQRRRSAHAPADRETRRTPPGEALPHTEAL